MAQTCARPASGANQLSVPPSSMRLGTDEGPEEPSWPLSLVPQQ
jgi:hypothetical protein